MLYIFALISVLTGFWCLLNPTLAVAKTRVLILHPHDETLPASVQAGNAIKTRLRQQYGDDLDIHSEYLELSRFPEAYEQHLIAEYIAKKFASRPLSVVISMGADALSFAITHRHAFGPTTPIVFCCSQLSVVAALKPPPDVFGIVSDYDVRETVDLAMRLDPAARRLVVIAGSSMIDGGFEDAARLSLGEYTSRLDIQYLSGLPRDELRDAVSSLPRDAFILMLTYFMDRTGQPAIPRDIAALVAEAASAPTYSVFDTMMGTGIVGGHMDTFENAGIATAELAVQVIAREVPHSEATRRRTAHRILVDARQLERWNFPRSRLPPDSTVLFEKPVIWETHRSEVIAALTVFGVAVIAVAVLLAQMRRRIKAEAHLKESEERLNFAAASGGIGLWQYDTRKGELWSSEHCRAIFGLPPNCLLTTADLLRLVHPEDRSIATASFRTASQGPHAETLLEFRIVRPDGQVRSIHGRGHSTLDGHGNPIRVSGIFRDLTAYRAVQKEAKELSRRILRIQDEERQRIAQELHDSTAQHLAAINLNFMALRANGHSIEQGATLFADIQGSLVAAMNELRTFTYLLYPQELAHGGLHEALNRYIEGFSERTGLTVTLRATIELDDLAQSLKHSLLRIVQESLANVHRHASASRVTIKLQRRENRVHLLIADDGVGLQYFPATDRSERLVLPTGVGIRGMMARARQLGGLLDVRSKSTGTLVHASLPIDFDYHATTPAVTRAGMSGQPDLNVWEPAPVSAKRSRRTGPEVVHRRIHAQQRLHPL